MKIVDTFMFNEELDLLEFRLEYLYDYVDHFVLVESNVSHRGYPKPIYYALYNDRFEKYKDKIIHVLTTDVPKHINTSDMESLPTCNEDPFVFREQTQRLKTMEGLRELKLDFEDIVLVSNIDELPDRNKLTDLKNHLKLGPTIFKQKWLVWSYTMKRNKLHQGTCAYKYTDLLQDTHEINKTRLSDLIESPSEYMSVSSGWHLNWFGNKDNLTNKVFNTSKRDRDTGFYYHKKVFRDLSSVKRFPHGNPSKVETLIETTIDDLPEGFERLPFYNPNTEPMIYDTFIYNGEEESLLIRLYELHHDVDYFVIFESIDGKDDFLLKDINDKLVEFDDKIIYVQLEDYDNNSTDKWSYELSMIKETLNYLNLNDNDYIFFSEIESIPSLDTLDTCYYDFETFELEFITLRMRWFFESFDTELYDHYFGTILTNWSNLKDSSLVTFYNMKDEIVHTVNTYRGWYLCNFYKEQYELYESDVILETYMESNYFPLYYKNNTTDKLLIDFV